MGIATGETLDCPTARANTSSQRRFRLLSVCVERCLGKAPQTVECGSNVLGGCGVLHGEGHIFLAPCDCRVVSPTDRLARPLLCRGGLGVGASHTVQHHAESGADILVYTPRDVETHRGGGARHTRNIILFASNAHRMLAIFWFMVFFINPTGATRPPDR